MLGTVVGIRGVDKVVGHGQHAGLDGAAPVALEGRIDKAAPCVALMKARAIPAPATAGQSIAPL